MLKIIYLCALSLDVLENMSCLTVALLCIKLYTSDNTRATSFPIFSKSFSYKGRDLSLSSQTTTQGDNAAVCPVCLNPIVLRNVKMKEKWRALPVISIFPCVHPQHVLFVSWKVWWFAPGSRSSGGDGSWAKLQQRHHKPLTSMKFFFFQEFFGAFAQENSRINRLCHFVCPWAF